MSLDYKYIGLDNTEAWTEKDWAMFNALVWTTIAVDIGFICETSADEFARRANEIRALNIEIKKEDLVKFYGLSTNVYAISTAEWNRIQQQKRSRHALCDAKWAKKVNGMWRDSKYVEGERKLRIRIENKKQAV